MIQRPRRSALYVPGSSARAIDKARSLPCDVIILDLEDMVGPGAKVAARAAVVHAVRAGGFGRREVAIRVNGLDTPWGADDLAAAASARPDAVLAPKISRPQDLMDARGALGPGPALWAMIETCAAVIRLDALGSASLEAAAAVWVIGSQDLAKEMRCASPPDRAPLTPALIGTVMTARAYGLDVLDGVFAHIADAAGFASQCRQGAELGFDGKTLIHPSQIDAANGAFSPTRDAVAWARAVVAAYASPANTDAGVLEVDSRLVERAHLGQAQRVIAISDAIAEATAQRDL